MPKSSCAAEVVHTWVYSLEHEDGIMAFTMQGIENLETLIADQEIAER